MRMLEHIRWRSEVKAGRSVAPGKLESRKPLICEVIGWSLKRQTVIQNVGWVVIKGSSVVIRESFSSNYGGHFVVIRGLTNHK